MSINQERVNDKTNLGYQREKHAAFTHDQAKNYQETRFSPRRGNKDTDRKEKEIVLQAFEQIGKQRSILDVPCGAGRFLETLKLFSSRLIELDLSFGMVHFNEEQYRKSHGDANSDNTSFLIGDAEWLPIHNDSVDAIFCMRLFHHLDSSNLRVSILSELARVTSQWAIVSFYHYYCFKHFKKILRNKTHRGVYLPFRTFKDEVEKSGLQIVHTYAVSRFINPQWVVVLKKSKPKR